MTFLEAAAVGMPLVCRDDASHKGVLLHGRNGYRYKNRLEFVMAISRILEDDTLRENMRQTSLRVAEKYSFENFTKRTIELYEKIIAEA